MRAGHAEDDAHAGVKQSLHQHIGAVHEQPPRRIDDLGYCSCRVPCSNDLGILIFSFALLLLARENSYAFQVAEVCLPDRDRVMPFVIQCPFCNLRARVPDRANGAIGKCPKCSNSFTLAPSDDQHELELVGAVANDADPSSSDLEPVANSSMSAAIAEASASIELPAQSDELTTADTSRTTAASPMIAERLIAATGLLLAGCAWACAPFAVSSFLVAPLSGLALFAGIAAIVTALMTGRKKFALPIVSCAVSASLLCMISMAPAFFGPTFERSRQRANTSTTGMQAIPLNNAPILAQTPEWTDASRYSLQDEGISLQIVSVSIGAPPGFAEPKPKAVTEKLLNVRVRVTLPHKAGKDAKSFDWTDVRQPRSPTRRPSDKAAALLRSPRRRKTQV